MENLTRMQVSYVANRTDLHFDESTFEDVGCYSQREKMISFFTHFSMVSYSITFLLGIAGNGLVIWISTFKIRKTVNIIWFLNLAIADLIFDVFLRVHIVRNALGGQWPFGSFMCKMAYTVLYLNMLVSISFLVLISIDRCVSVLFPVWARNHRTSSLAYKIAFATWLLAIMISSPYPAFYDITAPEGYHNKTNCFKSYTVPGKDFPDETSNVKFSREKIMIITRFVSMFIIPFAFIIICYGMIALKIKKRQLTSSRRPIKLIIIIIVLFFVCWFPYHAIRFVKVYAPDLQCIDTVAPVVTKLSNCLAYFNSCLNPILYAFIGRDFKVTFRMPTVAVFQRAFNQEPTLENLGSKGSTKTRTQVCSSML